MLKNGIVQIFIFCLGTVALQAQSSGGTGFRFGINGSPNISFISTDNTETEGTPKLRFGFGLTAEFDFADNYAFSSGVNIVNRGGELRGLTLKSQAQPTMDSISTTGHYKSQYIQIPLLLKMSTREFGYITYFAEFGGSLDFEISEEVEFSPELSNNQQTSFSKPLNAMFAIGGGIEYNLGGNTAIIAGLYYNRSLFNNLNDNDHFTEEVNNYTYRFDYVNLKVGVLF